MKTKSLTRKQESVLKSLRENYEVKYHPKKPNLRECHEVTLGNIVTLWLKLNGTIFAVHAKRKIVLQKCQPIR